MGDGSVAETRAVRLEMDRFVQRLRERGHRLEVAWTTPDGQFDVFEVRPDAEAAGQERPAATRGAPPPRMR